ncbi:MAG: UTP--glucose-1-phosphate uridylyltransferase [Verrucomicrobiia bacterium]
MTNAFIETISSDKPQVRNRSIEDLCNNLAVPDLLKAAEELDEFRRRSNNLYERVRSLLFLYAIYRFYLPEKAGCDDIAGFIPYKGYTHLLNRRFEEAIDAFRYVLKTTGYSDTISSALAAAYYKLGFQTLANQVRKSVRTVRGNQWMFRTGHPADQPLRIRCELLKQDPATGLYPLLKESTPVRMDLTHCGWSDIFFLGMDYPEGAKVLNVSIDLGVYGRDASPKPPVEAYFRIIDQPIIRLVSVDLKCSVEISTISEVFDFARDYLGLLKAAVIASGIVPPGIEGSEQSLQELLEKMTGAGRGIELVSNVNNIPKGSRLAVSTTLLASLISVCMRATSQARSLTGELEESERRVVLARALLGEWLSGSGGGWQDSGGLWPGVKLIEGAIATEADPEFGISRGRLMPTHKIFGYDEISKDTRKALQDSLVLVHGGMAQNVGPILEMVTEKYLLRCKKEWQSRLQMINILHDILNALRSGDIKTIGNATTKNFFEYIQTIIPWANNLYTETLIARTKEIFKDEFWGFWMLGGMSGGGMGFIFSPEAKPRALTKLQEIMSATKRELEFAMPFAMEPVVYEFAINEKGTYAEFLIGDNALMPPAYYSIVIPDLIKRHWNEITPARRAEIDLFSVACRTRDRYRPIFNTLLDTLLPRGKEENNRELSLETLLNQYGFDKVEHEQIRAELKEGKIGLAQNRLPSNTLIEDVKPSDVIKSIDWQKNKQINLNDKTLSYKESFDIGINAIKNGEVAVLTMAAGAGSRWTQGAGVVKALHPFCKLSSKYRTFIETHIAKTRKIARLANSPIPHIFTTSYLTHKPIADFLEKNKNFNYEGKIILSPGRAIGLRMIPTARDLRFLFEQTPQQVLDEQKQKVLNSARNALINWAISMGEAEDYTDNLPMQCLHPVGHWYEVPNTFRNGVLAQLLTEYPNLKYLVLHNIDAVGTNIEPALLGLHIQHGSTLSFEVISRRLEDRGGGLARVNGQVRLVESLAIPKEEDEFKLSYYNTLTTWIDIDRLLRIFGLSRVDICSPGSNDKIQNAIRTIAARVPTYITLKEVKKRWGYGQEDILPVAQFEKLWGDMSSLPELDCAYFVVARKRGQQLKDQAQLDGWLRDGSAEYVNSICDWE